MVKWLRIDVALQIIICCSQCASKRRVFARFCLSVSVCLFTSWMWTGVLFKANTYRFEANIQIALMRRIINSKSQWVYSMSRFLFSPIIWKHHIWCWITCIYIYTYIINVSAAFVHIKHAACEWWFLCMCASVLVCLRVSVCVYSIFASVCVYVGKTIIWTNHKCVMRSKLCAKAWAVFDSPSLAFGFACFDAGVLHM